MVDYARFIVDPWLGAQQAQKTALAERGQSLDERRAAANQQYMEAQTGLAQRGMGLREQEFGLQQQQESRLGKTAELDEQEKQMKLDHFRMKFFADGLGGVDDQES